MIDLHAHIIPGVDDGPAAFEETAEMLALAASDGITDLVATPHCDLRYHFDAGYCQAELDRIQAACPGIRLHLGCELHLTPENIERVLQCAPRFTLNGGDCILVEFPHIIRPAAVEPGLQAFLNAGLRPIIAHPERHAFFGSNLSYAHTLVDAGCYFQVTARSLGGAFGPAPEKLAFSLLQRRLVHFIASDCHGSKQRRPLLARPYTHIGQIYGEAAARLLFEENPRAVLESALLCRMAQGRQPVLSSIFRGVAHGFAS